jgi:site-specific DNA-methyltransferase (adenine-specific)
MLELNQLYNMDCMEGMTQFPDKYFELAIVDPEYRDPDENRPTKDMQKNGGMKRFSGKPTKKYFNELFRVSKNQIIWGANNFDLPNYKGFVVWKKLTISDTFTMSMAEIAYISEGLGTTSKLFEYAPQGTAADPRIHPTQKPVALYKWLLTHYAHPGDKILDTHVGSASSLIACHQMGFDYIGFEIDRDYWQAATERLEAVKAQQSLFFKEAPQCPTT